MTRNRNRPEALATIALAAAPKDSLAHVPEDIQRLWFTLTQRAWWSLVVMPGDFRTNIGPLAETLTAAGCRARRLPVRLHDAQQLELPQAAKLIEEMVQPSTQHSGVIVAVGSPLTFPGAIPVALAADAVLLCVELGVTKMDSAQQTVDLLGRQRFLGTVALQRDSRK
jgi:hypothetical protein